MNALDNAELSIDQIDGICFVSSSSPYSEKSLASMLAQYLDAKRDVFAIDQIGTTKSLDGIQLMLDSISSGRLNMVLLVASDDKRGMTGDVFEFLFGAGAGALILTKDKIMAEVLGYSNFCSDFTSAWRPNGFKKLMRHDDFRLEREAGYTPHIIKAINGLISQLKLDRSHIDHLVLDQVYPELCPRVAYSLGLDPAKVLRNSDLAKLIGYAGAAGVLLNLINVLENSAPGELAVCATYGFGSGASAMAIRILERPKLKISISSYLNSKEYIDYLRYAKLMGIIQKPEFGERTSAWGASGAQLHEAEAQASKLIGYRCRQCKSVNFPGGGFCIDCGSTQLERVKLPREGEIITYNIQKVLPYGPEEELAYCVARIDPHGTR